MTRSLGMCSATNQSENYEIERDLPNDGGCLVRRGEDRVSSGHVNLSSPSEIKNPSTKTVCEVCSRRVLNEIAESSGPELSPPKIGTRGADGSGPRIHIAQFHQRSVEP